MDFNNDIIYIYLLLYIVSLLISVCIKNFTFIGGWYQIISSETKNKLYLKIKYIRNIFLFLICITVAPYCWITEVFHIKIQCISEIQYLFLWLIIFRQLITIPFIYLELKLFKNINFGEYIIKNFKNGIEPEILEGFKIINFKLRYKLLDLRNKQNEIYDKPFFKRYKNIFNTMY